MYMKMLNYVFLGVIGISLIGAVLVLLTYERRENAPLGCTMEARICPDGTAVGRVGPNCEFAPCKEGEVVTTTPDDVDAHIASKAHLIVVSSPARDEKISSPVTITGQARGYWFFEASFPIVIVDWDGRIIGEGIATADGEWMTEDFVPFHSTVTFTLDESTPYRRGAIILRKDNPSGLPEHDDALEIPVTF